MTKLCRDTYGYAVVTQEFRDCPAHGRGSAQRRGSTGLFGPALAPSEEPRGPGGTLSQTPSIVREDRPKVPQGLLVIAGEAAFFSVLVPIHVDGSPDRAAHSGEPRRPRQPAAPEHAPGSLTLRFDPEEKGDRAVRTSRLEAFSDAIFAIIMTIMVLELSVPEGHEFSDLIRTTGIGLLTYLLSFIHVGIYWNNHHHLFHLVARISGGVLWANLALLFCLSLLPFTTAWLDHSQFAQIPGVVYGLNLLGAAIAKLVLLAMIIRNEGAESPLRGAIGRDIKGKVSLLIYVAAILSALVIDRGGQIGIAIALACYVGAAIRWIVPDRRIDQAVRQHPGVAGAAGRRRRARRRSAGGAVRRMRAGSDRRSLRGK
ncbi:TMEM175 family protein [Nonomuraea sp. NPDC049709]|uniref:TMEM175 family protein n=1 Tax=Nonomuraea sp. NPDC049709 TaxID=3154736 RepID=UPI0034378487